MSCSFVPFFNFTCPLVPLAMLKHATGRQIIQNQMSKRIRLFKKLKWRKNTLFLKRSIQLITYSSRNSKKRSKLKSKSSMWLPNRNFTSFDDYSITFILSRITKHACDKKSRVKLKHTYKKDHNEEMYMRLKSRGRHTYRNKQQAHIDCIIPKKPFMI